MKSFWGNICKKAKALGSTVSGKVCSFFAQSKYRKASLLIGCGVLVCAASVGTAFAYRAAMASVPASADSLPSSVSLVVSSSHKDSSSSSSESESESVADVQLTLVPSSATQDLNIDITNEAGTIVTGVNFAVHIVGTDEKSSYDETYETDLLDGNIYLWKVPAGNYTISIDTPVEGYVLPTAVDFEVEAFDLSYTKIEDISDQIVSENDVEVSKEDSAYGSSSNTASPAPSNTVTFVPSGKTETTHNVLDSKGNPVYNYTYTVGANGNLLLADGTESDVVPVAENGTLSYGLRYVLIGSTSTVTLRSASTTGNVTLLSVAYLPGNVVLMDDSAVSEPDSASAPSSSSSESSSESSSSSSGDSASSSSTTPETTYTVTFANPDGSVLSTSSVTAGGTATPPASPSYTKAGYRMNFTGWSGSYADVQSNLTVTAVYDIYQEEKVTLLNTDNTPVATYQITATAKTESVPVYTGWQTINGKTYYYTAEHKFVTGWQVIQGISYYFNSAGVRSDCVGIDVSRWNGTIDWAAVKASGVNFAIIRVGYRGYGTGALVADPTARTNLSGATAAGLKVGVYFFSQAVTQEEAVQEASMAMEMVRGYSLAYPIFIDSEYSTSARDGRADSLSTAQRTAIVSAFCQTVANSGYRTGVYASKSWLNYQLSASALSQYHIWLAHYTSSTDYSARYDIWQYSSKGAVNGIKGNVDMNLSYLSY